MTYNRLPSGPCMCGAMDCPSCGPDQGCALEDDEQYDERDDYDDYYDDADADRAEDAWRGDRF